MNAEFINCPWCGQRNPADALECRKCGGPLPVKGKDPGPTPPPPPRTLPRGYKRRMLWKNSPINLIGGIFALVGAGIGCIFPLVGLVSGLWLLLLVGGFIGLVFTALGGGMLYAGLRSAYGKIRPYEHGIATEGEIAEIFRDPTVEVNGRNPWAVTYLYTANGQTLEGRTRTWKHAPALVESGDVVHVLYLPEDPEQSVLYPPLG